MSIESTENANRFMTWLNAGITKGFISVNKENSVVHFLAEGMALKSPIIFKIFTEQDRELQRQSDSWKLIHRDLIRQKWHMTIGARKLNTLKLFPTSTEKDSGSIKIHSVIVIQNPAKYITIVPNNSELFCLRLTAS